MGKIKLKRGNNVNLGGLTLEAGEPAFVIDTGKLYIGDGTNKILINPDIVMSPTADKLTTARTISIAGAATGSASFDGSANATITTTLKDSGVAAGTYTKVTVDSKGIITANGGALSVSDIPSLTLSKISDSGTAASKNVGTASGNVPILNAQGKLDDTILPAIAVTDTFVVASEPLMLALTVEIGDVCVRTDLNKSFILKSVPATNVASWQELLNPLSPVSSVAGKTGAVTLTSTDVGLGNVTNESKTTLLNNSAFTGIPTAPTATGSTNTTQVATTAFVKSQSYAPLASPTLTGVPIAPTASVDNNTTQVATTAFVKSQGYLDGSSVLDGGTF